MEKIVIEPCDNKNKNIVDMDPWKWNTLYTEISWGREVS